VHSLKPITALAAAAAQTDHFEGLSIQERADCALASLAARQGQEAQCAEGAKALLGTDLPTPGKGVLGEPYSCFWMGADQWMVSADYAAHERLDREVKAAIGDAGSVTEQSDGWCRFDVTGERLQDVLERLCNVDLPAMQAGDVSRSRLEHMACFIWCLEPRQKVAIYAPRSAAGSLHHGLVEAARSVL